MNDSTVVAGDHILIAVKWPADHFDKFNRTHAALAFEDFIEDTRGFEAELVSIVRKDDLENSTTPRCEFHTLADNEREGRPKILVHGQPVVTLGFARSLENEINELRGVLRELIIDNWQRDSPLRNVALLEEAETIMNKIR